MMGWVYVLLLFFAGASLLANRLPAALELGGFASKD